MTEVERLAEFAVRASYDDLSEAARDQLKIRVLDSLGCAIGAIDGEPVQIVRRPIAEFDRAGTCTLITARSHSSSACGQASGGPPRSRDVPSRTMVTGGSDGATD